MINEQLIKLLIASAYCNWSSNLIGGPPISSKRFEYIKNIQVGDLVLETSTIGFEERDSIRIGYLLRITDEPIRTQEEWEREWDGKPPDEPIPTERVYYIRLLRDDSECRWTNASFIKVVTEWRHFPGNFYGVAA